MKKLFKNNVKYFYIIPAIVLLLFTVNTIANTIKKSTKELSKKAILNDKINIVIDKDTSDEEFSKIMKSLREQGIVVAFKDITRNENNEITAIKINVTKNGATSSYSANSNLGIDSIYIDIEGDFVSIHNKGIQVFGANQYSTNENDEATNPNDEIARMMQQSQAMFKNHSQSMEALRKMMEAQSKLFNNFNIDFNDEKNDAFSMFFSNKNNQDKNELNPKDYNYQEKTKATYIVNGKEMSEEDYKKMDKSKINSLEIKKEVIKSYTK